MSSRIYPAVGLLTAVCAPLCMAQPQLQEVVVTSSRFELPIRQVGAAVSVIASEEIALRGYNSMAELLRTQPGVAVSTNGGRGKPTALRIRGEEGFRTLVLIDGVSVSDPTGTQVGPQIQHLSVGADIERVEILRGPQGFVYGADAGGVVNIITRSAEGFASDVALEAGAFNTVNAQGFIAAGGERAAAFVSLNHYTSDGFNVSPIDESDEADGYDNTTVHSKFRFALADAWQAQLVARSTDATSEYDNCSGSNNCFNDFDQQIAKLSLVYAGANLGHQFAAAHTATDRNNFAAGEPSFAASGSLNKLEYLGRADLSAWLTVMWGGDAANEEMTGNTGEHDDRDQYGIFAEALTEFDDRFYLSIGLRHDDNEDFGEHLSARVAPAFVQELSSGSSIKYRASWGTGFRAPSLSEIFYNRRDGVTPPAAGVQLQEETSEGFDVGVEWHAVGGTSVQVGYFDQEITNEIYFDSATYSGYLQGSGVSHSRGVEFAFEAPLARHLTLLGNYTYNETLTDADIARARRPRHIGNLGLQATAFSERARLLVNVRVSRDAVMDKYGVGRVPLDDYEVMDVSLQYQPLKQLQVSARVENAFDEQYEEIDDFNTSGRAFYAGLKYSF